MEYNFCFKSVTKLAIKNKQILSQCIKTKGCHYKSSNTEMTDNSSKIPIIFRKCSHYSNSALHENIQKRGFDEIISNKVYNITHLIKKVTD